MVEAIAAPIRLKLTVEGVASHSGATPMGKRRDALVTASHLVLAVEAEAKKRADRRIVGTVGILKIAPGALNVVPGRAELWVDVRGIDEASLSETAEAIVEAARRIAASEGTRVQVETVSADTPVPMDPAVIGTIEGACRRLGYAFQRMPSGAGHDAMNMARIASAGMIFIPCRGGYQPQPRRVRLTRGHRAGHGCAHGDARRAGGVTSSRQLVDGSIGQTERERGPSVPN